MYITPMPYFGTPDSLERIREWIDEQEASNRAALLVVMGMTWNYLASVSNNTADTLDPAVRKIP